MQPMNKIPLLLDDDLYILIYSHSLPGRLYSFTAIENDPYFLTIANERMGLLSLWLVLGYSLLNHLFYFYETCIKRAMVFSHLSKGATFV